MDKVLTVVIPSYNVESYLEDTLESFVAPEILSEIEVLIVNDGSKDRTPEIAKEYEEKYPGTFRLISKENGGHGSTINRGIEEAVGTYFKVVDGDDWVNTSDFAELVRKLRTTNADYVVTKYYKVNDKTKEKKIVEFPFLEAHPECTFDEAASGSEIPMHALVIRTAILQEHRIRMDEHCFYVDNEYITFPVPYVETVVYYDLTVYMYRLAVATQSVSMQGFQKHLPDHVKVTMRLVEFAEEYSRRLEQRERKQETTQKKRRQEEAVDLDDNIIYTQQKARYLRNQAAIMVGDQAGIFASFPSGDREMKKQFIEFDRAVRRTSPSVYDLSNSKSKMLKALRLHRFHQYRFWTTLSKLKARISG